MLLISFMIVLIWLISFFLLLIWSSMKSTSPSNFNWSFSCFYCYCSKMEAWVEFSSSPGLFLNSYINFKQLLGKAHPPVDVVNVELLLVLYLFGDLLEFHCQLFEFLSKSSCFFLFHILQQRDGHFRNNKLIR